MPCAARNTCQTSGDFSVSQSSRMLNALHLVGGLSGYGTTHRFGSAWPAACRDYYHVALALAVLNRCPACLYACILCRAVYCTVPVLKCDFEVLAGVWGRFCIRWPPAAADFVALRVLHIAFLVPVLTAVQVVLHGLSVFRRRPRRSMQGGCAALWPLFPVVQAGMVSVRGMA